MRGLVATRIAPQDGKTGSETIPAALHFVSKLLDLSLNVTPIEAPSVQSKGVTRPPFRPSAEAITSSVELFRPKDPELQARAMRELFPHLQMNSKKHQAEPKTKPVTGVLPQPLPDLQRSGRQRSGQLRNSDLVDVFIRHNLWLPKARLSNLIQLHTDVLAGLQPGGTLPTEADIAKVLTPPSNASTTPASQSMLAEFKVNHPQEYTDFVAALPRIIEAFLLLPVHLSGRPRPLGTSITVTNPSLTEEDAQQYGGLEFAQGKLLGKAYEASQSLEFEVPAIKPGLKNSNSTATVETHKLSITPFAAYSLVSAIVLGVETHNTGHNKFSLGRFWMEKPATGPSAKQFELQMAKLRSFAHYLTKYGAAAQLKAKTPSMTVEYKRLTSLYTWDDFVNDNSSLMKPIVKLANTAVQTYKNLDEPNSYVVNFANKKLSGGFLSRGGVQEELIFLSCPVLTSVIPLVPELEPEAAMVIENFMQTATYKGYGHGASIDQLLPSPNPNKSMIVIDATDYNGREMTQYDTPQILREANKVLASVAGDIDRNKSFATGQWGCGAFKGDPVLKFMVQWAVTSMAGMKMVYYPHEKNHRQQVEEIVQYSSTKNTGELWKLIEKIASATRAQKGFYNTFRQLRAAGTL